MMSVQPFGWHLQKHMELFEKGSQRLKGGICHTFFWDILWWMG